MKATCRSCGENVYIPNDAPVPPCPNCHEVDYLFDTFFLDLYAQPLEVTSIQFTNDQDKHECPTCGHTHKPPMTSSDTGYTVNITAPGNTLNRNQLGEGSE